MPVCGSSNFLSIFCAQHETEKLRPKGRFQKLNQEAPNEITFWWDLYHSYTPPYTTTQEKKTLLQTTMKVGTFTLFSDAWRNFFPQCHLLIIFGAQYLVSPQKHSTIFRWLFLKSHEQGVLPCRRMRGYESPSIGRFFLRFFVALFELPNLPEEKIHKLPKSFLLITVLKHI